MYSGRGFRESEIGDIDVWVENGVYHLFHLILPNHDYIAHATSVDGIHWKRTRNALFVGEPGSWDDDMIWTMNVSKCGNQFQMYYTGLSAEENGHYQRIGRAFSEDLLEWKRDDSPVFPLEPQGPHYESKHDNNRQWVSFRDPYFYQEKGEEYLLFCARTNRGSMNRRGCVGLAHKQGEQYELQAPLFMPHVYDDVECPCIFKAQGQYYLLGSIREDVKVHYWHADEFQGEYRAFHNNVLMPGGNYAARVSRDGKHLLVYAFYVAGKNIDKAHRFLPPPKELVVAESGKLILKSFYRWKEKVVLYQMMRDLGPFTPVLGNAQASILHRGETVVVRSPSGYEMATVTEPGENWIWEGRLELLGAGKCGLVFDCDERGNGYYISLDCVNGFVQIRSWGENTQDIFSDYQYLNLQTNIFQPNRMLRYSFRLIRYGHYIELSLDGEVKLSLVDSRYSGNRIGIYVESAELALLGASISKLDE